MEGIRHDLLCQIILLRPGVGRLGEQLAQQAAIGD